MNATTQVQGACVGLEVVAALQAIQRNFIIPVDLGLYKMMSVVLFLVILNADVVVMERTEIAPVHLVSVTTVMFLVLDYVHL